MRKIKKDDQLKQASELRRKGEKIAREKEAQTPEDPEVLPPEEISRVLHELRVNQIELEIKNGELRQAQEELAMQRARYFDLFDLAPVGYCTVSEKGIFLEANLTAATLLGVTLNKLVTQPVTRFILKEDQDLYYQHRKQLFETGAQQICELRMKRSERTHFWARLTATMWQDAEGALICRVVISDITQNKRIEESLRDSEERYRSLFMSSRDGIVVVDDQGRFLDANDAYCAMLGYSVGELRAMNDFTSITPKKWHAWERGEIWNEKLLRKGYSGIYEKEYIRKDGSVFPVELQLFGVFDPSGKPKHLWSVARDITSRKQAEESQRAASLYSYTRSLIETSLDPFVTISAEGKITDVNTATEKITGISRNKLIGTNFTDYFTEPGMARAGYQKVFEQGQAVDYPLAIRHVSGTVTEVFCNASLYRNEKGEVLGAFIAAHDITERRRTEAEKAERDKQNRRNQKAESLARMAGAIAHHFNNKLAVIMGNIEFAMGNLSRSVDSRESLTEAMNAAKKISEISGMMLTYLGQTAEKREPLDLSASCRSIYPMLQAAIPNNVMLKADLPDPGPCVRANANLIHLALTNLVTNAWEAMGDRQGEIRLTIKTVSPADISKTHCFPSGWQPQDNAYACLEIADEGCGIAEENIERLFDPFFTDKFTGRGLGLSVVLGIARAYDGAVTVERGPDTGSVFRVFFPVFAEKVLPDLKEPVKAAEVAEMEAGGTVLLVDDEEAIRRVIRVMLNLMGMTVFEAKDGVEAVEVFQRQKDEISIVLCDLTMPRMNGWDTLLALRKLSPNIYFILSSGYSETQVMKGDHPELPQDFLEKPYQLNHLKEVMLRAMVSKNKK